MIKVCPAILLASLLASLLATGCSGDGVDAPGAPATGASPPADSGAVQIDAAKGSLVESGGSKAKPISSKREVKVRDVKCGCSIDGIGKCGNFILFDGNYYPLLNETLGEMEFCQFKDAGCKIKVAGAMKNGQYVADQWKMASR